MPLEGTTAGAIAGTSIVGPGVGTAIGGGIGLIGDLATSAFNVHESRQNRRFQRDMANTAHQREVRDLIAAGLNPQLSQRLGGSATPPTSAAQATNPVGGAAQGMSAFQLKQNSELIAAQTRNLNAQADKSEVDAKIAKFGLPFNQQIPEIEKGLKLNELYKSDVTASPEVLRAIARQIIADSHSAAAQAELVEGKVPAAYNNSLIDRTFYGKYIRPLINDILHGTDAYKNVK